MHACTGSTVLYRRPYLQVLVQRVGVLLEPALRAVHHVPREVGHDEGLFVREPLPLATPARPVLKMYIPYRYTS